MKWVKVTASVILLSLSGCGSEHQFHSHDHHAQAHHIANAAVLISEGETKIMFDPLPLSGFGVYPETPQSDIAQMMAGEGNYAGIDAVFISHAHSDHFSAAAIIAYMNAQPDVTLVAPRQALDMMKKDQDWDEALQARMRICLLYTSPSPRDRG